MGIVDKALALGFNLNLASNANATTPDELITKIMNWVSGIAGVVAFLFLIYGGFMYLTAAGNAEQSKKGGQTIINAILGLVIIAIAYGLTGYIVKILGGTSN